MRSRRAHSKKPQLTKPAPRPSNPCDSASLPSGCGRQTLSASVKRLRDLERTSVKRVCSLERTVSSRASLNRPLRLLWRKALELPVLDIRILAKRAFCKMQEMIESTCYSTSCVRMTGYHPKTSHWLELSCDRVHESVL